MCPPRGVAPSEAIETRVANQSLVRRRQREVLNEHFPTPILLGGPVQVNGKDARGEVLAPAPSVELEIRGKAGRGSVPTGMPSPIGSIVSH
jgi:hypothetical protein